MKPPPTPDFWSGRGLVPALLLPLACAYAAAGAARQAWTRPRRLAVPVICVGNLVAGGAGKTPVTLSLARLFAGRGRKPHILSRGYGGSLAGPVAVDPLRHGAAEIGDEPLLLAAAAPCWVARDRRAGGAAAIAAGAGLLLLDDGFQNPALAKDLSLLVVDGGYGFGNGYVLPAGPLREPIGTGLARADAVILLGEDRVGVSRHLRGKTVLRAHLAPRDAGDLAGSKLVAFAGIGRPAKFFATLEALGAHLAGRHAFPDHHPYREEEMTRLLAEAERSGARLVTTEKDAMRLPAAWRARLHVLAIEVVWDDPSMLAALADRVAPEI